MYVVWVIRRLKWFSSFSGVSDVFWLALKFTGPYGSAWLDPKYYWRPLNSGFAVPPAAYRAAYGLPPIADQRDAHTHSTPQHHGDIAELDTHETAQRQSFNDLLPPERAPYQWQIYLELATYCINPIVCFLGSWLSWHLHKIAVTSLADNDPLLAGVGLGASYESDGTLVGGGRAGGAEGAAAAAASLTSSQGPARNFIPFHGVARTLADAPPENEEEDGGGTGEEGPGRTRPESNSLSGGSSGQPEAASPMPSTRAEKPDARTPGNARGRIRETLVERAEGGGSHAVAATESSTGSQGFYSSLSQEQKQETKSNQVSPDDLP
eukprot:GHVT01062482.1.p1 GENE.GHVT01062482.1~~GHVT01062482.1.p1  ORF type:complete len:323 (-),score=58.00 GHVT01062482.1:1469-2437(-)